MLLYLTILSALAIPTEADATWETLSSDPVHVRCAVIEGKPWCKSTGIVGAPIAKVAVALEDMAHQADIFESVSTIDVLEPDTLRVELDFPGMLSDRDYVAKFSKVIEGEVRKYQWVPVTHADAPPKSGVVRLTRMAGEWMLEPQGDKTRVTYTWEAELMGSFPEWALPVARKKAGHEALKDLANAQKAELTAPEQP